MLHRDQSCTIPCKQEACPGAQAKKNRRYQCQRALMMRPGMGVVTVPVPAEAAPSRAHTRGTGARNSCASPPIHISSTCAAGTVMQGKLCAEPNEACATSHLTCAWRSIMFLTIMRCSLYAYQLRLRKPGLAESSGAPRRVALCLDNIDPLALQIRASPLVAMNIPRAHMRKRACSSPCA